MSALVYAALSDPGRVRARNEDRWFADVAQRLFIVSDGIGGAVAGAVASHAVVEVLPALIAARAGANRGLAASGEDLCQALSELSGELRADTRGRAGVAGMGATAVVALVTGDSALIAHLGDSRAYISRGGRLERLTRDHSLLQALIDSGHVDPAAAAAHPARGQLTRYVGMEGEALPETRREPFACGDRLLLCSDGLTGMLDDDRLQSILDRERDPVAACRLLVDEANHAGGTDNITALIIARRAGGE